MHLHSAPRVQLSGSGAGTERVHLSHGGGFCRDLARDSGLRTVSQTEPTGNARMDEAVSLALRPESGERIYVTIIGYLPERTLVVRIAGNISSPEAKRIAQRAEAVYEGEYPRSTLTAFTRYQGLLGP